MSVLCAYGGRGQGGSIGLCPSDKGGQVVRFPGIHILKPSVEQTVISAAVFDSGNTDGAWHSPVWDTIMPAYYPEETPAEPSADHSTTSNTMDWRCTDKSIGTLHVI